MYELIGRRIAACLLVLGCIVLTDMASAQPTDLKISWEVRNRFRLFREQSICLGAALKPTYIFPCDSRRNLPNMGLNCSPVQLLLVGFRMDLKLASR